MSTPSTTHDVVNQTPLFRDVNLFKTDVALQEAVSREGGAPAAEGLDSFGAVAGSAEAQERGRLANENIPRLRTHDPRGFRLDLVEYHPAYHALMETSIRQRLHCSSWSEADLTAPRPVGNVARAGAFYMAAQMEAGHCCPVTMTNAAVATLRLQPDLASAWLPKLFSASYDPSFRPSGQKSGVTIGMGMTEKQGGTDVRANTTHAEPTGDGSYLVTGHKWFMSAPMSDAFMILAQAGKGLSCFLMPRFLPDGLVNAIRFQRLKDKLGNRANASGEAEFHAAHAWLIGEEGRGIASIIEMVTATRLDCAVASAGLMRFAVASAVHHAEHRHAFGSSLIKQPLMRHVLADLALDVEAAVALSFRLARSFDRSEDPNAAAWKRLMTPVTKYWICKIGPALVAEAMECCGGNGYIEELPLARLYREIPVNAIWEGSGSVMALDVLRVLQREPDIARIVLDELAKVCAQDPQLKPAHARLQSILHDPRLLDIRGRELVEGLAKLAAGAILRAHAPAAVADAFIGTRLGTSHRQTYGQGLERADLASILARTTPLRI